jgi:hypothetical protein
MSWVRVDDRWWSDPDALALSAEARDLFVRLLSYCGCHDTDGALARVAMVPATAGQPDEDRRAVLLAELVRAGYMVETSNGWEVVEPARYLRSKDDVDRDRAIRRAGGLARAEQAQREGGRFASHQQPAGTSSTSSLLAPGTGDSHQQHQQPAGTSSTSTYPVPSRPEGIPQPHAQRGARGKPRSTGTNPRARGTAPRQQRHGTGMERLGDVLSRAMDQAPKPPAPPADPSEEF